jgi:hypothetical protein
MNDTLKLYGMDRFAAIGQSPVTAAKVRNCRLVVDIDYL